MQLRYLWQLEAWVGRRMRGREQRRGRRPARWTDLLLFDLLEQVNTIDWPYRLDDDLSAFCAALPAPARAPQLR